MVSKYGPQDLPHEAEAGFESPKPNHSGEAGVRPKTLIDKFMGVPSLKN